MSLFRKGNIFPSVTDQRPQAYWKFNDPYPQYIQAQRTLAVITGTNIRFNVNTFDPNTFMRSKAYIKVSVEIQKQEIDVATGEVIPSNYVVEDKIYKKPGLVLHNSCTTASLRLNSHTMVYKDLRYVQKKMDMSFAGKKINNTYMSTSGSSYEELNGVYNETGCINKIEQQSADTITFPLSALQFDVVTPNQVQFVAASGTLTFTPNAGGAIDLLAAQIFNIGDVIDFVGGQQIIVQFLLDDDSLQGLDQQLAGDFGPLNLDPADTVTRNRPCSFNGDDGREFAYDDAFKNITVGQTNNTFEYVEPLSFGCFNHLSDFDPSDIYCRSWNNAQTALVPYIRELELSMDFKDIAANTLLYPYGRGLERNPAQLTRCELHDIRIVGAELTLFWIKPRDELLLSMPQTVRIQSWMYDHKQFKLFNEDDGADLILNGATSLSVQNNIYTHQQPSYILYYAMVDKDVNGSYACVAVNTDTDGFGGSNVLNTNRNSVETGMRPVKIDSTNGAQFGANLLIRSNTLGGDDLFSTRYANEELYRITLKNSISDFPYNMSRFVGLAADETSLATYPSQFYFLLGESDLNSYFIRKGKLQTANVMDFRTTFQAIDGHSVSKRIAGGNFNGGTKEYAVHIIYIYDRFYISLSADGQVDSKFDAQFL